MDVVASARRSAMMAGIRGRDTRPEMAVRRMAHSLGYRYRLHRRDLPGTPDLVFPRLRKVLFVHGCFWHRHAGCRLSYDPKSNQEFWRRKFAANVARDQRARRDLQEGGWQVETLWECEVRDATDLALRVERCLASGTH
jgi:DNA mismatch endonuclease (patch repair protein)